MSSHLAALAWARADAALVHWNGRGTASDRQLAALLAGTASPGSQVHAAALIKSVRGSARTLLRRLGKSRATSPGYLHVQSRPAVFVALRKAHRTCARCTPLANRGPGLVAGTRRVPRLPALPRGRRRVVPGQPRRAHGQGQGLVPDPAGILAEQLAHSARDALDRRLATLDPADGRLACVASGDRLAQRLVARQRDRGEPCLGLGERLRPLPRRSCMTSPQPPDSAAPP